MGLLIGKKQDKNIIVDDAIPLFHQRVMSGALEIAFDMIESNLPADRQIVGMYEAPIHSKSNDQNASTLA